jgi:hypothetical protein
VETGKMNEIIVEVMRGEGMERMVLSGCAVVVMEGSLEIYGYLGFVGEEVERWFCFLTTFP